MLLREFLISSLLALLSLIFTAFLWREPQILFASLFVLSLGFFYLAKFRKAEISLFIACAILGTISEAAVLRFGAWGYAMPFALGVPIWLPLLWGNASLFILNTYRQIDAIIARPSGKGGLIGKK